MMVIVHGSPLYQWDINRQLLIDSADLGSDFVIHCCYTEDANALVVEPKNVDDKVLVNIPNILLQKFGNLRVYVVTEGDTVYDATFYVMARPKPDDYVYTETEVLSYVSLSKRMDELERNSVSDEKISEAINNYLKENPITESDPTVPAWAKASEKPKYTAKEVGALSQDELQNGVNFALEQAKESGEFNGADGKDGNDYVLTESDKQEIADMIEIPDIPESGGASGSNAWRKIADLNIEEDCGEVFINQDIDGKPFKAVAYYILLHSAIPTDETWTNERRIAIAPWECVSKTGQHTSCWGDCLCGINSGITNKATAITSSACYMSVGEGMAFANIWSAYNNGSMPDTLVITQRDISYNFGTRKALTWMKNPYSTELQFNGIQNCFSAGSRLMVWAIDYMGGE